MKWHAEVLDTAGIEAADRLAKVVAQDFYLAGGTALALRLGHRISLDLDLFSSTNRLEEKQRWALTDLLKAGGPVTIQESKDRTCHLLLKTTSVSLFHYPYALNQKTEQWHGLNLASFEDMGAMKVSAIMGRGLRKDFIDLYCICRKIGFKAVLEASSKKFPDTPDFFVQAAKALVYFADAEKDPMPRMLLSLEWDKLKRYFETQTQKAFTRHQAVCR